MQGARAQRATRQVDPSRTELRATPGQAKARTVALQLAASGWRRASRRGSRSRPTGRPAAKQDLLGVLSLRELDDRRRRRRSQAEQPWRGNVVVLQLDEGRRLAGDRRRAGLEREVAHVPAGDDPQRPVPTAQVSPKTSDAMPPCKRRGDVTALPPTHDCYERDEFAEVWRHRSECTLGATKRRPKKRAGSAAGMRCRLIRELLRRQAGPKSLRELAPRRFHSACRSRRSSGSSRRRRRGLHRPLALGVA